MRIILFFLHLVSRLPMRVLYAFSDIIFVLNYYVIGYRKGVVMENLRHSFPELPERELLTIQKQFFKNFCDYLVETAKSFTVTSTELRVRVQHINQHLFHEAKAEGRNVVMLAGHVFNWEWITALATVIPQEHCHPVYRKMQNEFWEGEIRKVRNQFGNQALEAHEVIRHMLKHPDDGNRAYMFVADQSPYVDDVQHGITFLNQKTPVFTGYDRIATRMDLAFIYCDIRKVKRGFYQINYYRILPEGAKFKQFEIVRKFHENLEKTIRRNPAGYLWSHRKWKYADAVRHMI